jgi:hypothetical protein
MALGEERKMIWVQSHLTPAAQEKDLGRTEVGKKKDVHGKRVFF